MDHLDNVVAMRYEMVGVAYKMVGATYVTILIVLNVPYEVNLVMK